MRQHSNRLSHQAAALPSRTWSIHKPTLLHQHTRAKLLSMPSTSLVTPTSGEMTMLHHHDSASAMQMKCEFHYTDGRQTAATSELASTATFIADEITPETIACIREEALAS